MEVLAIIFALLFISLIASGLGMLMSILVMGALEGTEMLIAKVKARK